MNIDDLNPQQPNPNINPNPNNNLGSVPPNPNPSPAPMESSPSPIPASAPGVPNFNQPPFPTPTQAPQPPVNNPQTPPAPSMTPPPEIQPGNIVPPQAPQVQPTPPIGEPASIGVPPTSPASMPTPPINLQPEGMTPPPEAQAPTPPEPLMGATLTANSTLVNNPTPTPNPNEMANQDNQINQITFEPPTPNPNTPTSAVPTPPPIDEQDNKKKKKKEGKKISTPLLIVLIVVLIGGIGYGVYYILNSSSSGSGSSGVPIILAKLNQWEKGETLPTAVTEFADISGIDASSCTIDSSNIDISTVGNQTYTINCPNSSPVQGTLSIKDTKGPKINLKEVVVTPNSEVNITDFVADCTDASLANTDGQCDIKLEEGEKALSELVQTAGTYDVKLVASDDYDNETKITATLKVDNNAPSQILACSSSANNSTDSDASVITSYEYGLTANQELATAQKSIKYTYKEEATYKVAKENFENNNELDGNTGTAKFDDTNYTITITNTLQIDALDKEFKLTTPFPTTFDDIVNFHEGTNGDSCTVS